VLTGEGADELHGGYAYFEHAALVAAAANGQQGPALSQFLAQHGARDGVLASITPKLRASVAWSAHGGAPYAAMRSRAGEPGMRLLMTPDFRRRADAKPHQSLLDWLSERWPQARILDDVTLSRFVALHTDLPRYNLCFLGDRAEMAAGLEARLPFLDSRVVDLLWRLPAEFHQSHGEGKRVLRTILARRLPLTAARPKRNFLTPAAPSGDLLRSPLAQRWLSMKAVRRAGIYRPTALAALRQLAQASRQTRSVGFYLGACLTMALTANLISDMFCDRFAETLARRSALSLSDLRARIHRDQQLRRAAE